MFLDSIVPLDIPATGWLDRVKEGDWIWLVKEKEPAYVCWAWVLEKPYYVDDLSNVADYSINRLTQRIDNTAIDAVLITPTRGKISIERTWRDGDRWGTKSEQTWKYIDICGRGLDGKYLFAPTKEYFNFIAVEPSTQKNEIEARFEDVI